MRERRFALEADPCLADHALEGTPVVPFALLAAELLADAPGAALAGAEILLPVLLRKGRAREMRVARDPDGASRLEDAAGRTHVRARLVAPGHFFPENENISGAGRDAADPGFAAYGPVLFHGPAFRADWRALAVRGGTLSARLHDADPARPPFRAYPWNAERPALLLDLAAQAAGLLLLAREGVYALPARCELLAARAPGAGPYSVLARLAASGEVDVTVADASGAACVLLRRLAFEVLRRPLTPEAQAFRARHLHEGGARP